MGNIVKIITSVFLAPFIALYFLIGSLFPKSIPYQMRHNEITQHAPAITQALVDRDVDKLTELSSKNIKTTVSDYENELRALLKTLPQKNEIIETSGETCGGGDAYTMYGIIATETYAIGLKTSDKFYSIFIVWGYYNTYALEENGIRRLMVVVSNGDKYDENNCNILYTVAGDNVFYSLDIPKYNENG